MDTSQLKDDELIAGYNEYSKRLARAKTLDKRYYNNKMENTFSKAMLSVYDTEMRNRGLIK